MGKPDNRNQTALATLNAYINAQGRGGVMRAAERLGCSHTFISLYRNNKCPGDGYKKLEQSILDMISVRFCHHDNAEKTKLQCAQRAHQTRPVGFRDAEAAWEACQSCQYKPSPEQDQSQTPIAGAIASDSKAS